MMSRLSTSPTKAKDEYTNIPQSLHPEVVPDGGDLEVAPQDGPESYEKEWNDGKIQYVPDTQNANYHRRLCGLAPVVFWILILLMITLLAAGLGAGLGVGLSAKSSNSTASTPTTNETSTVSSSSIKEKPTNVPSTSTPPSPSNPSLGCPANDTLNYTPASNSASSTAYTVNSTTLTYTIHCGLTYNASYNRDGTGNITDLQYIPATNLSTCIDLCSIYNIRVPNGGAQYGFYDLCSGVTVTNNETCQLKSGVEAVAKNADLKGDGQSAMLLW